MTCDAARRRSRLPGWLAVGSGLLAVALPKCPMCVAGYLSVVGLGATTAGAVVPVLRPIAFAILALSLAWLIARRLRRFARAPAAPLRRDGAGPG